MNIIMTLMDSDKQVIIKHKLETEAVIGRRDVSTGILPQIDLAGIQGQEKGVSRRHAVLMTDVNTMRLIDLGSRNGTRLNGTLLRPFQSHLLQNGDVIHLGRAVMRISF